MLRLLKSDFLSPLIRDSKKDLLIRDPNDIFNFKTFLVSKEDIKNNDFLQINAFITLFNKQHNDIFIHTVNDVNESLGISLSIKFKPEEDTPKSFISSISKEILDSLNITIGLKKTEEFYLKIKSKFEENNFSVLWLGSEVESSDSIQLLMFLPVNNSDINITNSSKIKFGHWLSINEIKDRVSKKITQLDKNSIALLIVSKL